MNHTRLSLLLPTQDGVVRSVCLLLIPGDTFTREDNTAGLSPRDFGH